MGDDQKDALVPPSVAWRRTCLTIGLLVLLWGAAIFLSGVYLPSGWYALTLSFGQLAGGYGWAVWMGSAKSVRPPALTERDGRTYVTAKTIAGRRTIDLHGLASVRYYGPVGKPETQKDRVIWRLRDGRGMRLAVRMDPEWGRDLEEALRQAVRPADGRQPLVLNLATSVRLTERQIRFGYQEAGLDSFMFSLPAAMFGPLATSLVAGLVH